MAAARTPASRTPETSPVPRPATGRAGRDHAAIARLADDLLPALIARLGASGLSEIEVRQGEWKARLRKPAGACEKRAVRASGDAAAGSVHTDRGAAAPAGKAESSEPEEAQRPSATSPAVGIYHPAKDLTVGMRVRAGDRLGTVDVLGVQQEVTAPVDGVVGSSLAEAGEAVEYGQELVRIEPPEGAPAAADQAVAVMGEA